MTESQTSPGNLVLMSRRLPTLLFWLVAMPSALIASVPQTQVVGQTIDQFQEIFRLPATVPQPQASPGKRWLVVICGLPGDELHSERMNRLLGQIHSEAPKELDADLERTFLLASDDGMAADWSDRFPQSDLANAESVQQCFDELRSRMDPMDSLWVLLVGHGNIYKKRSLFNISGPDIDQNQFAKMLSPIQCQHKVVWAMQPVSGFWLRPLASPGSVLVSATEPASEITGTEMAYAFGDVLSGQHDHQALEDIDKDGHVTILDLYLATCLEVSARFTAMERLQTEHAQLDDNGDGRGREIQSEYLPESIDNSKRFVARARGTKLGRDGDLARRILLRKPKVESNAVERGLAEEDDT